MEKMLLLCYYNNNHMASVHKHPQSKYYSAFFRDSSGRQLARSTKQTNKSKALVTALEFERIARDGMAPVKAALLKLGDDLSERLGQGRMDDASIAEEFERAIASASGRAASTKERYEQIKKEFLLFLGSVVMARPLSTLTASDVDGYRLSRLKKGLSGKSVNFELKFLRSVLKRALVAGRIPRNVAAEIPFEKENKAQKAAFSLEQIRALLAACKGFKKERGDDWRGAVLVAFYTGARLSDVANLKSGDLLLDATPPILEYFEKKKTDSGKVRRHLHPALLEFFLSRPSSDDPMSPLFPGLAGRKTGGAHGLSSEFVELMDAAGIERRAIREGKRVGGKGARTIYDLSEHSLRHSASTELAEAGVSEDVRMAAIGHESRSINRGYTHARKAVEEAVKKMPSVTSPVEKEEAP